MHRVKHALPRRKDGENTELQLRTEEEHKDTTCYGAEDDLDSGPFDDAQFSSGCPSPRSVECPSPRIIDCPSPMPPASAAEAGNLLQGTPSGELRNRNRSVSDAMSEKC